MKRWEMPSYFKNLLLLSTIIGVFPVLLLGYQSFHLSNAILKEELTSSNQLILHQNKEKIEALLKNIDTLTTQVITAPVTTSSISMDTVMKLPFQYEHQDIFERLMYALVQIQVYEFGIQDVDLISYKQNWIVDSGAIYPMENRTTVDSHDLYLHQLHKKLLTYREQERPSTWQVSLDENSLAVLQLIKHIPLHSIEPSGTLIVNIPITELQKHLNSDVYNSQLVIADTNGLVIASRHGPVSGSNIQESPFYNQLVDSRGESGSFVYMKDYLFQYDRSLYNNWTYMSITPLDLLMSKANQIKLYTILSVGILILLVLFVAYMFSHRLYLPISRMYRFIQPEPKNMINNELYYIDKHLKELTHSKSKLVTEVERLHQQAKEFFVFKLLIGEVKSDLIQEQLEHYKFAGDWISWNVISFQIDFWEDTPYSETDRKLLQYAALNIVEELVPNAIRLVPIIQNESIVVVMGESVDTNAPLHVTAYQQSLEIQSSIQQYLKLKVSAGISRQYNNWILAPLAYQESLDALIYRTRLGSNVIVCIDEVEPKSPNSYRFPKEREALLIDALKNGEEEQANGQLHEILKELLSNQMNHYEHQQYIQRLFNHLTGIVLDAGDALHEVFNKDTFSLDFVYRIHHLEQLEGWFSQSVISPLAQWSKDRLQKQDINITQMMLQEIEQHFDQDLSIEQFAAQLHYHPSYISRVFKKDTGINFTDYLTQYRIEIAKKWLQNSNLKVSEIAEKLRYSTSSNFIRNFKKVVQMTPSQYRDQLR